MAVVYLETDTDAAETIDRATILASSNVDELSGWFNDLDEFKEALRAQVEARLATETDDDNWLCRIADKMSFCGRGMGVIRRRLRELGADAPDDVTKLREMGVTLARERAANTLRLRFMEAAQEILPPEMYSEIAFEATRRVEAKSAAKAQRAAA